MSFIISLFYLYDPWLFQFLRMSVVAGLFACFLLLIKQQKIYFPIYSIIMIIILIILSFIPAIVYDTADYSVVIMYIKIFIMFVLGVGVYNLYYLNNNAKHKFIDDIHKMIYIQSILSLLALMGIKPVIQFLLSVHAPLEKFYESEQEYRLYSLTSSAFFQLSIFYAFLLHFILAVKHSGYKVSNIIIVLVLFLGVLSGRTFMVVAFISVLLYYIRPKYIPLMVMLGCAVAYLAINFSDNNYVAHAFEPIINLLEGKDNVSSSTTRLEEMWFLPDLKQIIIGDGYYHNQDGSYYGKTDVGFIRQLLYGGILYLFLCYYFTYYFVKKIANCWLGGSKKFLYSSILILSLAHMKADVYAYPGIMLFLIIFLSLFGMTRERTKC